MPSCMLKHWVFSSIVVVDYSVEPYFRPCCQVDLNDLNSKVDVSCMFHQAYVEVALWILCGWYPFTLIFWSKNVQAVHLPVVVCWSFEVGQLWCIVTIFPNRPAKQCSFSTRCTRSGSNESPSLDFRNVSSTQDDMNGMIVLLVFIVELQPSKMRIICLQMTDSWIN